MIEPAADAAAHWKGFTHKTVGVEGNNYASILLDFSFSFSFSFLLFIILYYLLLFV